MCYYITKRVIFSDNTIFRLCYKLRDYSRNIMPSIGTHNGKFHCDEVFACFLLKSLPEYSSYGIVRSRDMDLLSKCEILVDVGGEYNNAAMRYDHHQRDFYHTMRTLEILNFDTKLSSAGLVYAHFGKRVIGALLGLPHGDPLIDILYYKVYESFVEAIDAVDNGIAQYDGVPRYFLGGTLSCRVGQLNPTWNEPAVSPDERFYKAMALVGQEFNELLTYLYGSWLPARSIVVDAVNKRFEVDKSGQCLALDNGGVPWKDHFLTVEKQLNLENDGITYLLYPDAVSKQWRVQAIPISEKSNFENRLPLPESWRGLRGDELSNKSGIPGCVFVHPTGFIGGNISREGALQMAIKSLEMAGRYVA